MFSVRSIQQKDSHKKRGGGGTEKGGGKTRANHFLNRGPPTQTVGKKRPGTMDCAGGKNAGKTGARRRGDDSIRSGLTGRQRAILRDLRPFKRGKGMGEGTHAGRRGEKGKNLCKKLRKAGL